ncbi:MAG: cytidine deaminase, partial [Dermabacter sp.]|nr:cytidine deaminase [Dermabacter sp.]
MITPSLRKLVSAATAHAKQCNDDGDHTVAAALLTKAGRTVLGLNAFHFLGGPCGEISALANHAAECANDPVVAIVAVYGPTGQVISPCGKCRQVLFDRES